MRKRIHIAILRFVGVAFLFLGVTSVSAQPPDTMWARVYGGGEWDACYSMDGASDGGFYLGGTSYSFGTGTDYYVLRVDSAGEEMWSYVYDGGGTDYVSSIAFTDDEGAVVTGWFSTSDTTNDIFAVKLNNQGDTLWTQIYNFADYDEINSLIECEDNGLILAGASYSYFPPLSGALIAKTDNSGNVMWSRLHNVGFGSEARSIVECREGGFACVGTVQGLDFDFDCFLIRLNNAGDTLWSRRYGGLEDDFALHVLETSDLGFLLTGASQSFGPGLMDMYVIRTDSIGDTLWTRSFGGTGEDYVRSAQETSDGGFVVFGTIEFLNPHDDNFYLVRFDSLGNTMWTLSYGGNAIETGSALAVTPEHEYVIAGSTRIDFASDFLLVKTEPDPTLGMRGRGQFAGSLKCEFSLYPNPFNSSTTLSFELAQTSPVEVVMYDVLGRMVRTQTLGVMQAGQHQVGINAGDLSSGSYWVRLQANRANEVRKVVVVR